MTSAHQALIGTLTAELGSISGPRHSVPVRVGSWWWRTDRVPGQQHSVTRLVPVTGDGLPAAARFDNSHIGLDPQRSLPDPGATVGHRSLSPDGRWLAWSYDADGTERFVHLVRRLADGHDVVIARGGVRDAAWFPDSAALLVAHVDEARRPYRLLRCPVDGGRPTQVTHEDDPRRALRPRLSRSGRLLWVTSSGADGSRICVLDDEGLRVVLPETARHVEPDVVVRLDGRQDLVLVSGPAGDRRVTRVPLPAGDAVPPLAGITGEDALQVPPGLRLTWVRSYQRGDLAAAVDGAGRAHILAAPISARTFGSVARFGAHLVLPDGVDDVRLDRPRVCVTGPDLPPVVLEVDLERGLADPADGGTLPEPTLRRHELQARSADGTLIPMTVLTLPEDDLTSPAPVRLEVYGAYGVSAPAIFDPTRLPILRRGGRVVIAHVRGGGDLGVQWHRQAMGAGKVRTVADLLACARALRERGLAARILATGASAGGTMIAAAMNVEPDLFDGVLLAMPFVDPLGAMRDPQAPFTVRDRAEWGDPLADPAVDAALSALSPLQNVTALPYPPLRVHAATGDVRAPLEPIERWVEAIGDNSTRATPTELVVHPGAGHEAAMSDDATRVADLAWSLPVLFPSESG